MSYLTFKEFLTLKYDYIDRAVLGNNHCRKLLKQERFAAISFLIGYLLFLSSLISLFFINHWILWVIVASTLVYIQFNFFRIGRTNKKVAKFQQQKEEDFYNTIAQKAFESTEVAEIVFFHFIKIVQENEIPELEKTNAAPSEEELNEMFDLGGD